MKTLTVTVEMADSAATFAAGTVTASVQVTLLRDGVAIAQQNVVGEPCVATFESVDAGVVTLTAQPLAADGSPLGELVTSAPFSVDADLVSVRVASSISVTAA